MLLIIHRAISICSTLGYNRYTISQCEMNIHNIRQEMCFSEMFLFQLLPFFDVRITVSLNSLLQLSASGDSGMPEVVSDPLGDVSRTFQDLGVCVVRQCAKIRQQGYIYLPFKSLDHYVYHF